MAAVLDMPMESKNRAPVQGTCASCRGSVMPGDQFCGSCGTRIAPGWLKTWTSPDAEPTPEPRARPNASPELWEAPTLDFHPLPLTSTTPRDHRRRNLLLVCIALMLGIALIITVATLAYFNDNDGSANVPDAVPVTSSGAILNAAHSLADLEDFDRLAQSLQVNTLSVGANNSSLASIRDTSAVRLGAEAAASQQIDALAVSAVSSSVTPATMARSVQRGAEAVVAKLEIDAIAAGTGISSVTPAATTLPVHRGAEEVAAKTSLIPTATTVTTGASHPGDGTGGVMVGAEPPLPVDNSVPAYIE